MQSLSKIDPRYGTQALTDSGLETGELAIAPLDSGPGCPWVRQRRYERIILPRTLSATLSSSWGKSNIVMREMSLGGGMGTRSDNLRVGSEANVEISRGREENPRRRSSCAAPASTRSASSSSVWISTAATACAASWWRRCEKSPTIEPCRLGRGTEGDVQLVFSSQFSVLSKSEWAAHSHFAISTAARKKPLLDAEAFPTHTLQNSDLLTRPSRK